jgi:hypothetical protein
MQIHVSADDGLPVYKQIFNQVKYLVASAATSPFARRERLRVVRQRIDTLLADASHMGVGVDELKDMIDERDALMHTRERDMNAEVVGIRNPRSAVGAPAARARNRARQNLVFTARSHV